MLHCCYQTDEVVWTYRPAPSIVYDWMHKHCRHLLDLREKQMQEMLIEFTMGVDIYLQNLRDISKSEASIRMVSWEEFWGGENMQGCNVILIGHVWASRLSFEHLLLLLPIGLLCCNHAWMCMDLKEGSKTI